MQRQLLKQSLIAVVFLVLAGGARVRAQEITVEIDPAQSSVEFTLGATLHEVHGHFQLKNGSIHFDPANGKASGIIIADATSADTGNKSRDHKMHSQVLESGKFPEITFSPNKISGSVALQGSSTVQMEGIFRLHGDDHPMVLTVPVQVSGSTATASTRFIVPYVAWGLKNPSTFLLHVSDKVQVEVNITGHVGK
jgi:polyisoprenoid-binding protein YceI